MLKKKSLICRNEGFVAIEFALVVIPFIISILFIMELCRVIYIMSSIDIILSETSSAVATSQSSSGNKEFQKRFSEVSNGWALLLTGKNINIKTDIKYCPTINDLVIGRCSNAPAVAANATLAIYQVNVPYEPVFFIFPTSFVQKQMFRRVVLILENNFAH
ncbi:TadE/TadG family type IV pilus assembly protein [Enterobacter sp.]|uniref:TadE/TadG family type IV pilus assembly protein n=1 Tax=Enterobacter sp. TaxID=42895 RepID=UPI00296FC110|nr:TadE/TadG family type IV pilus assembly protein [Enterobacter sp.]